MAPPFNDLRDIAGPFLEPTIPAIRRIITFVDAVSANTTVRRAFSTLPARSILRTLIAAATGTPDELDIMRLRLAYKRTTSPSADDFTGIGLILPTTTIAGSTTGFQPWPWLAAPTLLLNWQLPDHAGNLIYEFFNNTGAPVRFRIHMLVDSPLREGA